MVNKKIKHLWKRTEWIKFSEKVKKRDNYQCLKCGRTDKEVVLQVHHNRYKKGKKPWEYPISDCITLCKGCHAREHGIIEPVTDWFLLEVNDLKAKTGTCERESCGKSIRYEHLIYHPEWGYKTVGSTCVKSLTEEDQLSSHKIIKLNREINKFIAHSKWEEDFTKKTGSKFIQTTYNHHSIRIYGEGENYYAFQIVIEGYDYKKLKYCKNINLEQMKELAYIALKGTTSKDEKEKSLLRDIYRIAKE